MKIPHYIDGKILQELLYVSVIIKSYKAIKRRDEHVKGYCAYDYSTGKIQMTWNVDPAEYGLEDLFVNYVEGELQ